jgi:hypothetical protein
VIELQLKAGEGGKSVVHSVFFVCFAVCDVLYSMFAVCLVPCALCLCPAYFYYVFCAVHAPRTMHKHKDTPHPPILVTKGRTAVIASASNGKMSTLRMLIDVGSDLEKTDNNVLCAICFNVY